MDPLELTRNKDPRELLGDGFGPGARVRISGRCGDWGAGNLGIVKVVATEADHRGRVFVGVLPDGMRDHVGRPEQKQLRHWADYTPDREGKPKVPPLPGFEAGLLTVVED